VIRRFLRAYGPSTAAEFGRWFSLEPALAKRLFAALNDELLTVDVEGDKRLLLSGDEEGFEPQPEAVHLLPHFDVYVIGSHPRAQLIPPGTAIGEAAPGTAAGLPVVLVGGRVLGVWLREQRGKRLRITVDAHAPWRKTRVRLARTAQCSPGPSGHRSIMNAGWLECGTRSRPGRRWRASRCRRSRPAAEVRCRR
jgi:hypothetical protein